MRKKTISLVSDTGMWYLIYLLPLLVTLVLCIHTPPTDILSFINTSGFDAIESTIIYQSLNDIFGANGILPLFSGEWKLVLYYMSYFVGCYIIHLAVDFLIFIPKFAHKLMDDFWGD